jgi:DNA helicase HerA-like ATPase
MGVLSRYEVTLERSLYKALHELQRLQAARDGQAVPLPVVVDVSLSDEADEMALIGENRSISDEDVENGVSN